MGKEKYGFVYITTNNISGKQYIGQKKYVKGWENYLGSGTVLNKAIKKYGTENFSRLIIEECYSKEELNVREIFWIDYYDATNNKQFYNIASGGDGGNTTSGYTQDEKFKIYQKSNKGKNKGGKNHFAKKVICLNTMEIFDTTVEAAKAYNTKDNLIQACCRVKSKARTAGVHPETKERLIWKYYDEKSTYTYVPFEPIKRNRKVICLNNMEIFYSAITASKKYNINSNRITSNCRHRTTYGGVNKDTNEYLYWIYYDEYIKDGINEAYYQRDKILQFNKNGDIVHCYKNIKDASLYTGLTFARIRRNIDGVTDYIEGFKFKEQYVGTQNIVLN